MSPVCDVMEELWNTQDDIWFDACILTLCGWVIWDIHVNLSHTSGWFPFNLRAPVFGLPQYCNTGHTCGPNLCILYLRSLHWWMWTDKYPAVLLSLPLGGEAVDLSARRAVGKLEEAGKHAVVLCGVAEDGILEVYSMRNDIVVLIHPVWQKSQKRVYVKKKQAQTLCHMRDVFFFLKSVLCLGETKYQSCRHKSTAVKTQSP